MTKESAPNAIGQKMKKQRLAKGLAQAELAALLGVARNTIAQWESGSRSPRSTHFEKIAKALDMSVLDLLGLSSEGWGDFLEHEKVGDLFTWADIEDGMREMESKLLVQVQNTDIELMKSQLATEAEALNAFGLWEVYKRILEVKEQKKYRK